MDIMEFLKTRRTYRRFEQKPVEPAIAREIMEAARIASCGANRQTLKYVLVQSPEMAGIFYLYTFDEKSRSRRHKASGSLSIRTY